MARSDADWEDDDEVVEALEGSHPHGAGGTEDLANALLEMTANALKLSVWVSELDSTEWNSVVGRLAAFLNVVSTIPREPTKAAKKVGFKAPVAKKPTRKKKG